MLPEKPRPAAHPPPSRTATAESTPTPSGPLCPTDPVPTTVATSDQTSQETDREALVALFNATDGESWDNSGAWASRRPIEQWRPVVTDDNGRVIHLELNQLSGEIPPEVGNLTSLKTLQLGGAQLTGEIPPELGNLINLESLILSYSQVSGKIPAELGNLINLRSLGLGGEVTDIPPELGNLACLETLLIGE